MFFFYGRYKIISLHSSLPFPFCSWPMPLCNFPCYLVCPCALVQLSPAWKETEKTATQAIKYMFVFLISGFTIICYLVLFKLFCFQWLIQDWWVQNNINFIPREIFNNNAHQGAWSSWTEDRIRLTLIVCFLVMDLMQILKLTHEHVWSTKNAF